MYLCIGIDCLDKTTLIGVRDVPQSLVEFRGAAAHVCSQRIAITFDTPRLPRKQADPTPERPSNATKNTHVAPILMVPCSFGF